jgi:hypothetical protein
MSTRRVMKRRLRGLNFKKSQRLERRVLTSHLTYPQLISLKILINSTIKDLRDLFQKKHKHLVPQLVDLLD